MSRGAIQRYFTKVVVIPVSPNTNDIRNYLEMKLDRDDCSKCERQGHNLFYVDNTAQVRGGLQGTLGEE